MRNPESESEGYGIIGKRVADAVTYIYIVALYIS